MITVEDALQRIVAHCRLLEPERVTVDRADGRVLAQDVVAEVALPPFDNAAMDGFALQCAGATLPAGREFEVIGVQAAGDAEAGPARGVWRIMTGAALPPGTDTVVPVEQAEVLARGPVGEPVRIRLDAEVWPGQHVRHAGEDIMPGARVLAAGARIGATERMALAALGVGAVTVRRRPRAALISTGRELVDDPAQPLAASHIRNCNGPYLASVLEARGVDVMLRATIADDPRHYAAVLREALALGCDLLVSTGAVSMGEFDFVPGVLQDLGAEAVFHKVRMRPGKPLLFAVMPGGALYFGLPGNPVSAAVGMRFFVETALRAMSGQPRERALRVPLREPVRKKAGMRHFQKARLEAGDEGRLGVRMLPGQESFRILPLVQANAWALLPEAAEALDAGSLIEVYGLASDAIVLGENA